MREAAILKKIIYINYKYFPISIALSQRRKLEGKICNYCRRFKSDY
jgi:hypothetical protein